MALPSAYARVTSVLAISSARVRPNVGSKSLINCENGSPFCIHSRTAVRRRSRVVSVMPLTNCPVYRSTYSAAALLAIRKLSKVERIEVDPMAAQFA